MAAFQSTVQELAARLKGSGILEIAAYDAASVAALAASTAASDAISWKNVGSIEGLKMKEDIKATQLKGDNALEEKYASDQTLAISFNQREAASEDVRAILRGALDVSGTPVAAGAVSGFSQVVASGGWAFDKFIPFSRQNGSKAKITPTSVTAGTNGLLVLGTDYAIVEQSPGSGIWGIVIWDSSTVTTIAQTITIVYDYTPYASQTTYSGGKTTIPYFMARITNTDENGLLVRFWAYKCAIDGGYDLAFKKDDDADPIVPNAVSATAILDTSIATLGKQLWKWYQERGIA
jgi:hypothetical protein